MAFLETSSGDQLETATCTEPGLQRGRLSAEEERELARAWRDQGDETARERLVTANLGLVVFIAQHYRNGGVPLEELVAEGNVGLLNAVEGFDPDCGSRFSTYAAYWIRQGIGRAFAANSPRGRLSSGHRKDLMELERAIRRHYAQTGEMPTTLELAGELGWSTERVNSCRTMTAAFSRPHSLSQPEGQSWSQPDPNATMADTNVDEGEDRARVDRMMQGLTPIERAAIEFRFGLHGAEAQGVQAIAQSLDCTPGEVRVALRTAMSKLQRTARTRNTEAGLDDELVESFQTTYRPALTSDRSHEGVFTESSQAVRVRRAG